MENNKYLELLNKLNTHRFNSDSNYKTEYSEEVIGDIIMMTFKQENGLIYRNAIDIKDKNDIEFHRMHFILSIINYFLQLKQ